MIPPLALSPSRFLGSVRASRDTLGRPALKLLEIVDRVSALTDGAPYAIVGGLAQMLWARKTHTDDLDMAIASSPLGAAYRRVAHGLAEPGWSLPKAPDVAHEKDEVFEVYHLLFEGVVVDLLTFASAELTSELIGSAVAVPELGDLRFARPELLLITQLLRPGTRGALAAIDLLVARRELGGLDVGIARQWAQAVAREPQLDRALEVASAIGRSS